MAPGRVPTPALVGKGRNGGERSKREEERKGGEKMRGGREKQREERKAERGERGERRERKRSQHLSFTTPPLKTI